MSLGSGFRDRTASGFSGTSGFTEEDNDQISEDNASMLSGSTATLTAGSARTDTELLKDYKKHREKEFL